MYLGYLSFIFCKVHVFALIPSTETINANCLYFKSLAAYLDLHYKLF